MIRECLKPEDYLSIVSFADIAKVVIPPTKVDSSGTVKLQEAIKSLVRFFTILCKMYFLGACFKLELLDNDVIDYIS